jgi:hypothetical protein
MDVWWNVLERRFLATAIAKPADRTAASAFRSARVRLFAS